VVLVGGWQIAAFRALVASSAIVVFIPEARRSWKPTGGARRARLRGGGPAVVLANKLTTAANTCVPPGDQYRSSWSRSSLAAHERVTRRDLVFMAVLGAGLALLFVGGERRFPRHRIASGIRARRRKRRGLGVHGDGVPLLARDRAADHGPHGAVAARPPAAT